MSQPFKGERGGGAPPQAEELVMRGPFHGPEQRTDAYLSRDPTTPTNAINVDNLFGNIQSRPGIEQLMHFWEADFDPGDQMPQHLARPFEGEVPGTADMGRARDRYYKSLQFVKSSSAIEPQVTTTTVRGTEHPAMTDVVASGGMFTMDSLAQDSYEDPPNTEWLSGNPDAWSYPRYKIINLPRRVSPTFTDIIGGINEFTGANWVIAPPLATHTPGSTTPLVAATVPILAGVEYELRFGIVGGTVGSVVPSCGGFTGAAYPFGLGSYVVTFLTSDTTPLAFTPSAATDLALKDVTLRVYRPIAARLKFDTTNTIFSDGTIGSDFNLARVVGGYVRDCQRMNGVVPDFTTFRRIIAVIGAPGGGGHLLYLDAPWPDTVPPTLPVFHEYAIFMPIVDQWEPHISGPHYSFSSDYCEVPLSQGSEKIPAYYDTESSFQGRASDIVRPSAASELQLISVLKTDTEDEDRVCTITPGMSFRYLSEPPTTSRSIVSVVGLGALDADDPTGSAQRRYIYVWPPIAPFGGGGYKSLEHYEILGRTQYWATGCAGSSMVCPGASPIPGQLASDPFQYVANCCVIFGNRVVLGTDVSYPPSTLPIFAVNGIPAAPNGIVPQHHPGSVAFSSNLNYNSFDSTSPATIEDGAGLVSLPIGPIIDLFVMRDVLYCLSERGMMAGLLTGDNRNPIEFRILWNDKRFASWSRAVVIDDSTAIIAGTDDLFVFNGSSLKAVASNMRPTYQRIIAGTTVRSEPGHLYYDQNRARALLLRGTSDTPETGKPIQPLPRQVMCGELLSGDWTMFKLPNDTGGAAEWTKGQTYNNGRSQLNVELLLNTTQKANITNDQIADQSTRERVMSLRWSPRTGDMRPASSDMIDTDPANAVPIDWIYQSGFFDMGEPRDYKTISRIRIVYQITNGLTFDIPVTIKIVASDGTTPQNDSRMFNGGVMFLPGGNPGEIREYFWTGAQASDPLNLTGFTFYLDLSQPDTTNPPSNRPIIREIGVTFRRRKEIRQF